MELVRVTLRRSSRGIEGMIRSRHGFVRRAHRCFRLSELAFAVGERRFARLEVELPRRHLLGENGVGLREIGQLRAKRLESRARRLMFFGETTLTIARD